VARRLHILSTEDDRDLRGVLAEILEAEGYRVTFSTALDVAEVAADPPDLLLLDGRAGIEGVSSGWAFLERLKADADTAGIPVLVLTAETVRAGEQTARLATLDTVLILKPFDLDDLIEQVRRRLAGESA
jgi:DNA-binding response OmpR family regulator